MNKNLKQDPKNYLVTGGSYISYGRVVRDPSPTPKASNWEQIPCVVMQDIPNDYIPLQKLNLTELKQYVTIIQEHSGVKPSDTVVTEKGWSQAEDPGKSMEYSRGDHTHGTQDPMESGVFVGGGDMEQDDDMDKLILRHPVYKLRYDAEMDKLIKTKAVYHDNILDKLVFNFN